MDTYEKKYNEALEKARQLCAYPTTKPFTNDLQDIFPELKDSEDETIRKRLIQYFNTFRLGTFAGLEPKKIIAWLEKQKEFELVEQKPEWSEEEQQNIDSIIAALTYCNENGVSDCFVDPDVLIVWLKSLRPQKQWKPSEDQIMALRWVLNHIPYDSHKEEISGLLEQLKKLREE